MLRKSFVSKAGSTHSQAVHDPTKIELCPGHCVVIKVGVWVTATAKANDNPPMEIRTFVVDGDDYTTYFDKSVRSNNGMNLEDQAIAYLLAQPEYSGAEDV